MLIYSQFINNLFYNINKLKQTIKQGIKNNYNEERWVQC